MSNKWLIMLVTLMLSAPAIDTAAPQIHSPVAIGMLAYLWGPTDDMLGLRDGLAELGYHQNEHIALGVRFAEGRDHQLKPIVRQLVSNGAAVLYVSEWNVLQATQRVTAHIPIVFTSWYHPAYRGGMDRLTTLGKNVTGVIHDFPGISPTSLERFQLLIPTLKRVLVPYDATARHLDDPLQALRVTATRLGIELVERAVRSQTEAKQAIMTAHQRNIDGVLPVGGEFNISGYALEATLKHHVPSLCSRAWMAEYGGLASYGPSWHDLGQQAAGLVDKIIQGAKPETLPVEVSQQMTFVSNLRTAKLLGLTIPPEVLYQANRLIH